MRIEKLHLKNFRCFKELDIQFPESNLAVFIGLNGAGKTAILDAISWAFPMYAGDAVYDDINAKFNDDVNIMSDNMKIDIELEYNSTINSYSFYKERNKAFDIIKTIDIQNSLIHHPQYIALKYNSKRERTFYYDSKVIDFSEFKEWFISERAKESNERDEKQDYSLTNPKLNVIRKAIQVFLENTLKESVSNLRVKYNKNPEIFVTWNGKDLNISQLSDGQKNLLLLVVDIAFALVDGIYYYVWNNSDIQPDTLLDALNNKGIVLIDEIELHLHPQWQREVLPALQKTFPNIQFIVTTHSPQVLSNLKKEEVFILKDNKIIEVTPHIEGRDSNSILYELFGVEERPERFKAQLKQLYNAIDDENLSEAKKILAELTTAFGEQDTEIVRANLHLSFAEE